MIPKISQPEVKRIFARPRLYDLLSEASDGPLTWITGPAGSGKTCLAASFAARSPRPCVWLHLDADDAEPGTFFHYLTQAARGVKRRIRVPAMLPEHKSALSTFARQYFRTLFRSLPASTLIVLDNYEALEDVCPLHGLIAQAITETPPEVSWLVVSRHQPNAVFAPLQSKRKLAVLGWETLSFTLEESQQLACQLVNTDLGGEAIERLHAQCQGWAAGVVLAVGNAAWRTDTRPTIDLPGEASTFDYFAAEIFGSLEQSEQRFLLITAHLSQLTEDSARKLSGHREAGSLLETLTKRHYFTFRLQSGGGFGRQRASYRYHPLFREFLVEQATRCFPPTELVDIRRRAALLLSETGQFEEAAKWLLSIADFEQLCAVVRSSAKGLLEQSRHEVLSQGLTTIPEELADEYRGWLLYWRATARLPFSPQVAKDDYAAAFECFRRLGDPEGLLLSWAGATETLLYGLRSFRELDFWIDALDELSKEYEPPSLPIQGRVSAMMHGALMFRRPYDPTIFDWEKRVRRFLYLSRMFDPNQFVMLAINLLHHDLWSGRIAKGRALLERLDGVVRSKSIGPVALLAWHTQWGVFGHFTGDGQASVNAAQAGLRVADETGVHSWDFLLLVQGVFGAIVLGDTESAAASLERLRQMLNPEHHLESLLFYDASAQTALAEGNLIAALEYSTEAVRFAVLLGAPFPEAILRIGLAETLFASKAADATRVEQAYQQLTEVEVIFGRVESHVLAARCHVARAGFALSDGDADEAARQLGLGFGLCREHGYFGFPWWRRCAVARLCEFALMREIEVDYVRELIRRRALLPARGHGPASVWAWPTKVFTFGNEFQVLCEGTAIEFSGKAQRRPLELLQALIAFGGTHVAESRLASALWPDSDGDLASQALATTLHRLRRLIGSSTIVRKDQTLSLRADECWVDCLACERTWVAKAPELSALDESLSLFRGPFLAERNDVWVLNRREQLNAAYARAVEHRAGVCVQQGHWQQAVELYERALGHLPGVEILYRGLLGVLRESGRLAHAADVYRRCCEDLIRYEGRRPSSETRRAAGEPV